MQVRKILLGSLAVGMFLSLLVIPTKAMSASVVLYASADTFISSKNPSTNYGTEDFLELAYTTSGGNDQRHILLKFDLSTIPSTAVITDARIRLYQINPSACDGTVTPNEVTLRKKWDAWEETEMDWSSGIGNVPITTRTGNCSTNWGFIVTDTVQDWVNGEENNGFILMGFSSTIYTRFFYSREHGTNMPELDVSYTLPDASTSTTTSTSTSTSTSTVSVSTSTSTSVASSTTSVASTSSEEAADTEVQVPELTGIQRNGVSQFATWDGVNLASDDSLTLTGHADPGATITITVGDFETTATADEDGNWSVEIQSQDLSVGEHIIIGQASLDGSISAEEPLVMVNVLGEGEESLTAEDGSAVTSSIGTILIILAVIFVLFVVVGLIVLLIILKKRKSTPVVEDAVKTEEVSPAKEVVKEAATETLEESDKATDEIQAPTTSTGESDTK